VEGDDTGVIVNYSIGETDVDTGKCRRYTLTSDTVMPDAAEPNYYKVTVPPGTLWSLVQAKPGRLSATLTSTKGTVIEFIKTSP
jgi:hypothetical protein